MHICFLGGRMPVTPERRGAIERLTMDLGAELVKRGHNVTIITVGEPPLERYTAEGVSLVEITKPIERPPSHVFPVRSFGRTASRTVARIHEETPVDVVHAVFYPTLLGFTPPAGVPLVVTEHNAHPWRKEHKYIENLTLPHRLRWEADTYIRLGEAHVAFRKADRVFSVSDAQGKWIDHCVPEFRRRRETMYDFVDTDKFSPGADRSAVSLPDSPTVLYAGRKVPHKGLHRAVAALAEIEADVSLAILGPIGSGFTDADTLEEVPRTDLDPYLERVFRTAETHGVTNQISLTGFVPDETLPGYYAAADIVAFPSVLESFGLVPIEAMACGTPVVAHAIPPMTETIVNGETGYLTRPTPEAFGRVLDDLISDPTEVNTIGRRGREHVIETFSLRGQTDAHIKRYRQSIRGDAR